MLLKEGKQLVVGWVETAKARSIINLTKGNATNIIMSHQKAHHLRPPSPKSPGRRFVRRLGLCVFLFLCFDLFLTLTRQRHFRSRTPFFQSLLYRPGEDGTYSQNYQDVWFLELARYNGWDTDKNGFFLDIGAYSGVWCSNSKLLEQELGWNGACVEPFPTDFEGIYCRALTFFELF